jgi:hypothetical protein
MDCRMKAIAFSRRVKSHRMIVVQKSCRFPSGAISNFFLCGIYSSLQSLMMTPAEQSANSSTYSAHTSSRAHATPAESTTAAAAAAKGTSHPETVVNIGPANNHRRRFNS